MKLRRQGMDTKLREPSRGFELLETDIKDRKWSVERLLISARRLDVGFYY